MNLKKLLTVTVTVGMFMLSCGYTNAMKPAGDKANTFKPDPILNAPRNTSNHKKEIIMLKNGDVSTVYEYITEVDFGDFVRASKYYDLLKAKGWVFSSASYHNAKSIPNEICVQGQSV